MRALTARRATSRRRWSSFRPRPMADVPPLRPDLAAFAEHIGRPLSERQAYDLADLRERITVLLAARLL